MFRQRLLVFMAAWLVFVTAAISAETRSTIATA